MAQQDLVDVATRAVARAVAHAASWTPPLVVAPSWTGVEAGDPPTWTGTPVARIEHRGIAEYLDGELCRGLLVLLALSRQHRGNVDDPSLASTFAAELAARLGTSKEEVAPVADGLWQHLSACTDLLVWERTTPVGGVSNVVTERARIAADPSRITNAFAAVRVLRDSARPRYAKLVMPHSREDRLVPIERLYVTRVLRPTTIGLPDNTPRPTRGDIPEDEVAERRFVVIGNPGAGKSTYMRHLLFRTANRDGDGRATAPLVVELKDYQTVPDSFLTALTDQLRRDTQAELTREVVRDLLLLGLATVVFDGLDEISDISRRRLTVEAISAFVRYYPLVRVVVTSREEGYAAARLEPGLFPVFRLPDFTHEQVETYCKRWFAIADEWSARSEASSMAKRFIQDSAHVIDLRTNPLMLSLLCLIYRYEGYIPENRPEVYEECAELLFERWDAMRRVPISVSRNAKTKYLVQELGYYFFNRERTLGGEAESKLRTIIIDYYERHIVGGVESARQKAQDFLDYCAGRAWLLTDVNSEGGERLFGFTHRTFMEYYAARYIVRHCRDAAQLINMIRPLLTLGTSEVVPQIAIQQFDDKSERGADECFDLLLQDDDASPGDRRRFLDFTLRSLRYMRPSAGTMQKVFDAAMTELGRTLDVALAALLLATPEDTHELLMLRCERQMTRRGAGTPTDRDFGPNRSGAVVVDDVGPAPVRVGAVLVRALLGLRGAEVSARDVADRLTGDGFARELEPGLVALARRQPDVMTLLNERQLFATGRYVEALGVRALVSVQSHHEQEIPGRLVGILGDFFVRNTEHPDLRPMLAAVYGEPSSVVPMIAPVVWALMDSTKQSGVIHDADVGAGGIFTARIIERHFPVNGSTDSLGLRMLYTAVMCAAFDHEVGGTGALHTSRTWKDVALAIPGLNDYVSGKLAEQAKRSSKDGFRTLHRTELVQIVVHFCAQLGVSEGWRWLFKDWAARGAVFSTGIRA